MRNNPGAAACSRVKPMARIRPTPPATERQPTPAFPRKPARGGNGEGDVPTARELIHELFEYTQWADQACLFASRTVSDREYYLDRGATHSSIHRTLVHIMACEWLWLQRWRGEPTVQIENDTLYPDRISLAQRWPLVHSAMIDFLDGQSPRSLMRTIEYVNSRGERMVGRLLSLMIHLTDHATYHRGQLNSMIRSGGGSPASTSFQIFSMHRARPQ